MDPEATYADFIAALRDGDAEVASHRLDDLATWLNRGGFAPARLTVHGLSLTDLSRLLTSAALVLAWAAYDLKEGETT